MKPPRHEKLNHRRKRMGVVRKDPSQNPSPPTATAPKTTISHDQIAILTLRTRRHGPHGDGEVDVTRTDLGTVSRADALACGRARGGRARRGGGGYSGCNGRRSGRGRSDRRRDDGDFLLDAYVLHGFCCRFRRGGRRGLRGWRRCARLRSGAAGDRPADGRPFDPVHPSVTVGRDRVEQILHDVEVSGFARLARVGDGSDGVCAGGWVVDGDLLVADWVAVWVGGVIHQVD